MSLSDQEKKLIRMIDEEVHKLREEGANDAMILAELDFFIPLVKSLIEGKESTELTLYFQEYTGFHYYIQRLEDLNHEVT